MPLPTIPPSCPFSIRNLDHSNHDYSPPITSPTIEHYLIREHDSYGEYPNIYAKVISVTTPFRASVIVLSDTGCGTQVVNAEYDADDPSKGPGWWDIGTFLDFTINRGDVEVEGRNRDWDWWVTSRGTGRVRRAPYLIMTTHCHFDHILGIAHLPPRCGCGGGGCCCYYRNWGPRLPPSTELVLNSAVPMTRLPPPSSLPSSPRTSLATTTSTPRKRPRRLHPPSTILSSSHAPQFITPYDTLAVHSLCCDLDLPCPRYTVGIWATHLQRIFYFYVDNSHPKLGTTLIKTGITILHTPGHTPDSLSWYDEDSKVVSVGDGFYERESRETKDAPWGREPPQPVIFTTESDLVTWWGSLQVLRDFVVENEKEEEEECEGEWTLVDIPDSNEDASVPVDPTTPCPRKARSPAPKKSSKKQSITLSAAHVTTNAPALPAIDGIKHFMSRILRDEVPFKQVEDRRGEETGLWDDTLVEGGDETAFNEDVGREGNDAQGGTRDNVYYRRKGRWSVVAPLRVVEGGRKGVPRKEWT